MYLVGEYQNSPKQIKKKHTLLDSHTSEGLSLNSGVPVPAVMGRQKTGHIRSHTQVESLWTYTNSEGNTSGRTCVYFSFYEVRPREVFPESHRDKTVVVRGSDTVLTPMFGEDDVVSEDLRP